MISLDKDVDIYVSNDVYISEKQDVKQQGEERGFKIENLQAETVESLQFIAEGFLNTIFGARSEMWKMKRYIERFGHQNGFRKMFGILDAHGFEKKDVWYFADGRRERPIKNWITTHDGTYACLILRVCNPKRFSTKGKHSLVMHADTAFAPVDIELGSEGISGFNSLILPSGEEIDLYTVDHHFRSLRS